MKSKDRIAYLVLILIALTGIYLKNFLGGLLTGASSAMIFLSYVGKRLVNTAARRIDKSVKDIIVKANQNAEP